MKKFLICVTLLTSFGASAFGLPSTESSHASKLQVNAENISSALKVIHDEGITCKKITKFTPTIDLKGFNVQCDNQAKYTVINSDNGMMVKTK